MPNKQIIEKGFDGPMKAAWPTAPAFQRQELRNAFFGGANFILSSMMKNLETGEDVTAADLNMMADIQDELLAFIHDFEVKNLPTMGNA
ncbi:MAG: hypothetical protein AB7H77_09635 [Bdellovibrionales bacterium]